MGLTMIAENHAEELNDEKQEPGCEANPQGEFEVAAEKQKINSNGSKTEENDCVEQRSSLRIFACLKQANDVEGETDAKVCIEAEEDE